MKARTLNLVLLGLCLGLLGILGHLVHLLRNKPVAVRYVAGNEVFTNQVTQIAVRKINATNFLSSLLNRPLDWSAFESTNYVTYIERLTAFGCPEETIRDIIIADIAKLYAKRKAALKAQVPTPKYWQSPRARANTSPSVNKAQAQLRELDAEQRALVKDLLNVDLDAELAHYTGESRTPKVHLDFLSSEKQSEVELLLKSYPDSDLPADTDGPLSPLEAADRRRLEEQRDIELAEILSPDELFEFQVRNSTVAKKLQQRLETFDPSESEFRQLFQLQQSLDHALSQRFDNDDLKNDAIRTQVLKDTQHAYAEELKLKLGKPRHAEYVRSQDADYQALVELSNRLDLPKTKAASVYDLKTTAQKQREAVAENANLTEAQRQSAYAGIARETQKSVADLLGQDLYAAYRETSPSWIYEQPPAREAAPEPIVIEPPAPASPMFPPMPPGFLPPGFVPPPK